MVFTDNIAALHPDLQEKCLEFKRRLTQKLGSAEYVVRITCTYRDSAAQGELYRSGRGCPGIILTHKKPGESLHGVTRDCAGERAPASRAFDFAIFWLGKKCAEYEQEYQIAGAVAEEIGLTWGGRPAAKYREPGHVELSAGYQ